jgi:2-succinyl-6-hydroxy-2,4-cyclohexadiene-1-carboxylate synthase
MLQCLNKTDKSFGKSHIGFTFLHGAVGSTSDWVPLASQLSQQGIQSEILDLWRFLEQETLSLTEVAEVINLEAAKKQPAAQKQILIGYSMGGRIALHALLQNTSIWDGAIIISAHTGLTTRKEKIERCQQDAMWAEKAIKLNWSTFLEQWEAQSIFQMNHDMVYPLRNLQNSKQLAQYKQAIAKSFLTWSLSQQENLLPALASLNTPILYLAGEQDEKYCHLAQQAAGTSPSAQYQIISKAKHRIPWENPEGVNMTIQTWAKQILNL